MRNIRVEEDSLKDYVKVITALAEIPAPRIESILMRLKTAVPGKEKQALERVLIEYNLKTALQTAVRYRGSGILFSRLIMSANKALVSAVKKWPHANDENFEQFISWSIEGAVIDLVVKSRKKALRKG